MTEIIPLRDIIQIFGPPGAGKDEQSKILVYNGFFKQISTGKLFTKIKKEMNPPELAKVLIARDLEGKLYSDDLVVNAFRSELDKTEKIPIADGIPRTIEQAYMLDKFTNTRLIFNLQVPDEICHERMQKRANYDETKNLEKDPLVREKRLIEYHTKTEPLLKLYDSYKIVNIDGTKSIDDISKQILDIVHYTNLIK